MTTIPAPRAAHPLAVWLAAFLLQLPLVLNPGYYSHDELQWAAFAADGVQVPWLDLATFQYRPLTFNLWMVLSRALFDTPMLFHALLVAWGSANAALLAWAGRGFGMRPWPAALGALAFALSPYAVYVHGWVGCIADLLWVGCGLLLVLVAQRTRHDAVAALAAAVLTAVALLAKEAAFAIPPLLAVAWVFDGRKSKWLAAMTASGLVCAAYLWLRLDVLLHAPREGPQYALGVAHVPVRWLEYQLFLPLVPVLEILTALRRPLPAIIAALVTLGMFAGAWTASRRLTLLMLAGGVAALLPVLPLAMAFNHYAYGFAAVTAMAIAAAWLRAGRSARIAIGLFVALTILHGGVVVARMHEVGRVQSVFSPALADAVRRSDGPVRLALHPEAKPWMFERLVHDIPHYRGVPMAGRVRLVEAGRAADYRVLADGRLQRLR